MKKFFSCVLYFIIGVVFYLLDRENEFISDDLYFALSHPQLKPITCLSDLFKSQMYDHLHENGRFVIQSILQLFCSIIGPDIFYILNTFVFLAFLYGLVVYIKGHCIIKYNPLFFILIGLLLLVPAGGHTFLGNIAGAVNYLWSGCAYIWWINIYEKERTQSSISKILILFFMSILVGSLQESFCIGIVGALLIINVLRYKNTTTTQWIMTVGFFIGASICILAPANFIRLEASAGSSTGLLKIISGVAKLVFNAKAMVLMVFVSCVFTMVKRTRKFIIGVLRNNILILLTLIINSIFVAFVAYTGSHQLTCVESLSTVVLLCMLLPIINTYGKRVVYTINTFIAFALLVLCIPIYMQRHELSEAYSEMCQSVQKSQDGYVVAEKYFNNVTRKRGWLRSNFLRSQEPFTKGSRNRPCLSLYLSNGKNATMIRAILPLEKSEIIKECNDSNMYSDFVFNVDRYNFWVVSLPIDNDCSMIKYQLEPTLLGQIRNKIQYGSVYSNYEDNLSSFDSFESNGMRYFVILNDRNYDIKSVFLL